MGYKIREIRESIGMSQTELCKKAGITRATLWSLETGKHEVAMSATLIKIAEALGVQVGDLFLTNNV